MLQAGRVSGTAEHRHPAWQPGRPARQVVSSDCRQIRKPSGAALVAGMKGLRVGCAGVQAGRRGEANTGFFRPRLPATGSPGLRRSCC